MLCSRVILKVIKNIDIPNLQKIKSCNNNFIYHAGTKIADNAILAVGGRVLNFVSISDNYLTLEMKLLIK